MNKVIEDFLQICLCMTLCIGVIVVFCCSFAFVYIGHDFKGLILLVTLVSFTHVVSKRMMK